MVKSKSGDEGRGRKRNIKIQKTARQSADNRRCELSFSTFAYHNKRGINRCDFGTSVIVSITSKTSIKEPLKSISRSLSFIIFSAASN